ncbi:MAG: hypothetical protein CMO55_01865 [Verrucomicrobiales bacterium]|nr:hypothetical protein [Verrucomicrobiales bacterium]
MTKFCATATSLLLFSFSASAFDYDTTAWFKGNTHTHSLWSDGNDFPEMIFSWYRDHGYDFIGLSDHNVLQEGEKWMTVEAIKKRQRAIGRDAISKCEARWGKEWIQWETRDGKQGIILKTLAQCREALEKPGEFYLLRAEEVSNSGSKLPVHINAINLKEVIPAIKDDNASPRDVMQRSLGAIREYGEKSGVPVLAHLNHPNFQWALTAEDLANVAEGRFFEVYNGHPGINHYGDDTRPGDEEIWDIANTIRLAELDYPPLLGVATDDSHTYHGGDVSPGKGWVVVGADSLNGDEIVNALQKGKFYSSSGVELERITFDQEDRILSISVIPDKDANYTIEFIGTRKSYDATAENTGIGEVFATMEGTKASFQIPEDALYMRATITSSVRPENPSYPEQKAQAWVQPVGWEK